MRKPFKNGKMLKKVTALGLCMVILGSQLVFAEKEETMKDSSGNKIGTCYALGAKYVVKANTKSVKTSSGKYKYESYVLAHADYLDKKGQYKTKNIETTSAAGNDRFAAVQFTVNTNSDAKIVSVATTHHIWKNGTKYIKSLND